MKVYIINKFYGLTDSPRPYACVSTKEKLEEAIRELKEQDPNAHTVYSIVKIKTLSPDKAEYLVRVEENGEWTAKNIYDLPVRLCPQIDIKEDGYLVYESSPEAAIEEAKKQIVKYDKKER